MPKTNDQSTALNSSIDFSNEDHSNSEMIPFHGKNIESIDKTISTHNKISKQSSTKSKFCLLIFLILCICGLILLTILTIYQANQINHFKQKLGKYQQLNNQTSTSAYQTTSFHRFQPKSDLKWKQYAQTIAGGNRRGDKLNQLNFPNAIYVDHQQQHIYIANWFNHRIVKWKLGENEGQIVAGGNGQGNRIDQLNWPTDVIVDENSRSLIICDSVNGRVVRWSLENPNDKQIIINNISCYGLMMNENGDLFVSDWHKHEVKRWRKGEIGEEEGTVVAGGNGEGDKLNQLNGPTFLFIDREETVHVSDARNHRVMKWLKGAKEGIIVAGGQGKGNSLNQLSSPEGLIVNEVGDVYVADRGNHRIMCWSLGSNEGRIVVGGNGLGSGSNQLNCPCGLSSDVDNNLYVADMVNHRIQRFSVEKTEK